MQTLKSDFDSAMHEGADDARGMSVLEAIGYDVDSLTQQNPINVQVTAATSEISLGGLASVAAGANLQVRLGDQNVLYDLERTCVSFTASVPYYQVLGGSIVDIFQAITCQIGSLQFSQANSVYLQSMLIGLTKEKHLLKHKKGIGMDLVDMLPAYTTNDIATQSEAATLLAGAQQKMKRYLYRARCIDPNAAGNYLFDFSVPLCDIWPQLKSFEDKVLPCVADQAIVLNAQLMPASYAYGYSVNAGQNLPANASGSYSLSNFTLTKVYTQLTPASVNAILKDSFRHQVCSYINTIAPLSQSTVFNVTVPSQSRCKRLMIGLYPTISQLSAAGGSPYNALVGAAFTMGNLYTAATPLAYKWGCMSLPMPQLSMVQINFSGQTITINQQMLSTYQQLGIITWQASAFPRDDLRRKFASYLVFDFERMKCDLFGSRLSQTTTLQVQLQFQSGGAGVVFNDVIADDGTQFSLALPLANFNLQSFLEVGTEVEQSQGIFKYA